MVINEQCQLINGKLMRMAALLPDLASLSPLDYDTTKRADPEVLKRLTRDAKFLRVRSSNGHINCKWHAVVSTFHQWVLYASIP